MKQPLISIIIPVYNTGENLRRLITKILSQRYDRFELILVDDGSTDDSLSIIREFQKKDPRIIALTQKNSGPAMARNSGLRLASGKYIFFLDSDDDIAENFFELMTTKIEKTSCDLVACGLEYKRLSDGTSRDVFSNKVAKRRHDESLQAYIVRLVGDDGRLYGVVNKVFRKDIIERHGLFFDGSIDFGEDLLFVLAYLLHAKRIEFIYKPLYIYMYGTETSVVNKSSLFHKNWQQNWTFLKNWFTPENRYESDILNWVRYRWAYSYCMAVCRSKKKLGQKYRLLKKAPRGKELPRVGKMKNIGKGKYLQEVCYWTANKIPGVFFVFILIIARVNRLRV